MADDKVKLALQASLARLLRQGDGIDPAVLAKMKAGVADHYQKLKDEAFRDHNLDDERNFGYYLRPRYREFWEQEADKRGLLKDYKGLRDYQMQGVTLPSRDY